MNSRSAVLSIAVAVGVLAAAPLSSVLAGGKSGVVTTMKLVDPSGSNVEINTGELQVKFVATPSVIPGGFDIEATFHPTRLVHTLSIPFSTVFFSGMVHGDANVTVGGVQPGVSALLTATGMRAGSNADSRPLTVSCVMTVDGAGHITLLALSLFLSA